MFGWEEYKKMFFAWENATANVLEQWLKSPLVLEPAGAWLSTMMKMKSASDRAAAAWWGTLGLPTKRDQERALHKLNQLESRLIDLEERLAERV
jgi:predicted nucleotidyltransferase